MPRALTIGTAFAAPRPRGFWRRFRDGFARRSWKQPDARVGMLRRMRRLALMALGFVIMLLGALIAPLPGPFGLPVAVVGLVIVLRNSWRAKRWFIRAQRSWPKYVYPFRRLMRKRPEFGPVFWQQALRFERFAFRRNRVLVRLRRRLRAFMRRPAHA